MTVSVEEIRDLLLPGLRQVVFSYSSLATHWETLFAEAEASMAEEMSALSAPPVSLPVAVAMGAAAVVIKNPTVTWRFLGWFNTAILE